MNNEIVLRLRTTRRRAVVMALTLALVISFPPLVLCRRRIRDRPAPAMW